MVSNLVVVLCGDQPASPIVNAQIEMLLRRALANAGRMPKSAGPLPRRGRPPMT